MKHFFAFIFVWMIPLFIYSQNQNNATEIPDTNSFLYFLKGGEFHVQARSFFMATDNAGKLADYFALAAGAGLSYESKSFHGLQVGGAGFFIYNVLSSDLTKPDPSTGAANRYEIGLFNLQNPGTHRDLERLEQLYAKYTFRKSFLQVGKFILNTPFINKQDGRMRPNAEEGIHTEINEIKNLKITATWLWALSPRSTIRWFTPAKSVGLYPSGVNPDGSKSAYFNNITSKGIGLLGLSYQLPFLKINAWDTYFENVLNTAMMEIEFEKSMKSKKLFADAMYVHQDALNYGGNVNQKLSYTQKGGSSNCFSVKAGIGKVNYKMRWQIYGAYTHITGDGRFLFPREWGREPFYTFMIRERNEGEGNVNAGMIRADVGFENTPIKISLAYGHYYLPDVKDVKLNKYGMPSYNQMNFELNYSFRKFLKGLSLQTLVAYKGKLGNTYGNNKYVINKVDMVNYNLIVEYNF